MIREQRLCGINGYHYRGGPWEMGKRGTTASEAIAIGDGLMMATGVLQVMTSTGQGSGVALGIKSGSDGTTAAINFLKCHMPRTKFTADVKTNSLASTEVGLLLPLSGGTGAMGIDGTDGSGDDFFIDQVLVTGSSGRAAVIFAGPEHLDGV